MINISKENHRKIDKHFNIIVNGFPTKILNYKKGKYIDNYSGEEIETIELITKIDSKELNKKLVRIEIKNEGVIQANWITRFSQPGLLRYKYKINKSMI